MSTMMILFTGHHFRGNFWDSGSYSRELKLFTCSVVFKCLFKTYRLATVATTGIMGHTTSEGC